MTRGIDGGCVCKSDECLVPYRDTYKCARLDDAHPYGGTKLKSGRCGCATDAASCIMPTRPHDLNQTAAPGFLCLKLKGLGGKKTKFGHKYYRGKTGHCKCLTTRCHADPTPSNVGSFRCIDVEKNGAYVMDPKVVARVKSGEGPEEDVKCSCAPGACTLPGATGPQCIKCPVIPGDCRSLCTQSGIAMNVTTCVKYCSTQHVTKQPKPETGYIDMFDKKNYQTRVTRCFVSKEVTCTSQSTTVASAQKCTQKVTARVIFDCPGRYSKTASRKLVDGTETFGFTSVCGRQNYECQREKCFTGASAALCLQKTMLT